MIVIYVFLGTVFMFVSLSTAVLANDFKSYKKVYDSLPSKKFYRNGSQVYSHKWNEEYDGFVWFIDDNGFYLDNGTLLNNSPITYLSPYSLYWLIKYRRWFAENIDINKLENY